jgi:hypothetical protein
MSKWPTLRVTDAYDPDARPRNPGRPMRDVPRRRKSPHRPRERFDADAARASTVTSGGTFSVPGRANLGGGRLRALAIREAAALEREAAELLARARVIREQADKASYSA